MLHTTRRSLGTFMISSLSQLSLYLKGWQAGHLEVQLDPYQSWWRYRVLGLYQEIETLTISAVQKSKVRVAHEAKVCRLGQQIPMLNLETMTLLWKESHTILMHIWRHGRQGKLNLPRSSRPPTALRRWSLAMALSSFLHNRILKQTVLPSTNIWIQYLATTTKSLPFTLHPEHLMRGKETWPEDKQSFCPSHFLNDRPPAGLWTILQDLAKKFYWNVLWNYHLQISIYPKQIFAQSVNKVLHAV